VPRVCTLCSHKDRLKIDSALVSRASIRGISRNFAVSEDALCRHKAHVGQAIVRAIEKHEEALGESILGTYKVDSRMGRSIK